MSDLVNSTLQLELSSNKLSSGKLLEMEDVPPLAQSVVVVTPLLVPDEVLPVEDEPEELLPEELPPDEAEELAVVAELPPLEPQPNRPMTGVIIAALAIDLRIFLRVWTSDNFTILHLFMLHTKKPFLGRII